MQKNNFGYLLIFYRHRLGKNKKKRLNPKKNYNERRKYRLNDCLNIHTNICQVNLLL